MGNMMGQPTEMESINPATGEVLGKFPVTSTEEVKAAIQRAKEAQKKWAALSDDERKGYLTKMGEAITAKTEHLADWIVKEQGKPLMKGGGPGAMFEVGGAAAWTTVPATLDLEPELVFEDATMKAEKIYEPLGVVGAITPWNWPVAIGAWSVAPALRVGNTVVLKPSEYTTLCTLELVKVMQEVLPFPGILEVITGGGSVGAALVESPDLAKIVFTGSTATGKRIASVAGTNLTRVTMECGGNDPAIIVPGAKMDDKKFTDLAFGAFINTGQTCAAAKRLYVHEDDYDRVLEGLTSVLDTMKMGEGHEDGVIFGPVSNKMQYDIVKDLVDDAKKNGGRIIRGGEPSSSSSPGYFFPITLVADLDNGSRLVDEEQFGPVLPVIKYKSLDDALTKANQSDSGLGASVWGDDIAACKAIAANLQAGTVWINQHANIHPMIPFGGVKQSGYGLEFGIDGLKAMCAPKIINIKK